MAEKPNLPLSVILEEARKSYIAAIASVDAKYNLPAFLSEPILSGILVDVRTRKMNELAADYASLNDNPAEIPKEEPKKADEE